MTLQSLLESNYTQLSQLVSYLKDQSYVNPYDLLELETTLRNFAGFIGQTIGCDELQGKVLNLAVDVATLADDMWSR